MVGNTPVYTLCPRCCIVAEERERLKEETTRRLQVRRRLDNSGIPYRFIGETVDSFAPARVSPAGMIMNADAAKKTAERYVERFHELMLSGGSLIFCGKPGTGKTHLACGIAQAVIHKGYTAKYTTAYAAIGSIKATWGNESTDTHKQVVMRYVEADLLIMDEIGVQFGTDAEKILIYEIISGRYDRRLPTILISNFDRKELVDFIGERCVDRVEEGGGIVLAFNWDSMRPKKR